MAEQDSIGKKVNLAETIERSLKECGLKLSQGQEETKRQFIDLIEAAKPGEDMAIYVRGISGSGKSTIFIEPLEALEEAGVHVHGDMLAGKPLPGIKIFLRQAGTDISQEVQTNKYVIEHKGFTPDELKQILLNQPDIPPERIDTAISLAFGSAGLAEELAKKLTTEDSDSLYQAANIAGRFLKFSLKGASLRRIVLDENLESFKQELSPYVYELPEKEALERIFESFIQNYRVEAGITLLEEYLHFIDKFLSKEPIDGIPFSFKAPESRQIYEQIAKNDIKTTERRYEKLLSEPGINVLAPVIPEEKMALLAKTLGISFTNRGKDEGEGFGNRHKAIWGTYPDGRDKGIFGKTGARMLQSKEDGTYKFDVAYWDHFWNMERDDYLKPGGFNYTAPGKMRRAFPGLENKPMLFLHTHQHGLDPSILGNGMVVETLLQNLDIPYLVFYGNCALEDKFLVYSAKEEKMIPVEANTFYDLAGKCNLEDLQKTGAEDSSYFEPLLLEILSHFNSLMKVYQAEEEEN